MRSDSAVDQGMDEDVAAARYLPGPRELLDAGTDQGAATEAAAIAYRSASWSRWPASCQPCRQSTVAWSLDSKVRTHYA